MTTHPDPDLAAIAGLDWTTYACNCPCHPDGCPHRATHIVEIHALHACNEPGLVFGNHVELRCYACLLRLQLEVGYRLTAIDPPPPGVIDECTTCGAPLAAVTDIVRDWQPL